MSYWTFTDAFFEEGGVFRSPFSSGFGLIATGSIPKASFNAFKLLRLLGDQQLPVEHASALATLRPQDGSVVVAIWNYVAPKETGSVREVEVRLEGSARITCANVHLLDDDHGSPLKAWEAMGSPAFPTRQQQERLRRVSEETLAEGVRLEKDAPCAVSLSLKPDALAVVEFLSSTG